MSLDLAWDKLDAALAQKLVDIFNKQLAVTQRPSFIGPVEVTGFDFGTVCPDIEVVDMRDIYRDFLEDNDEDDTGDASHVEGKGKCAGKGDDGKGRKNGEVALEEEEYEWIPRHNAELAAAIDAPSYHTLSPHMRYGRAASVPNLADFRPSLGLPYRGMCMAASMYGPSTPSPNSTMLSPGASPSNGPMPILNVPSTSAQASSMNPTLSSSSNPEPAPNPNPSPNSHPNIQLHLRILHHSDLRLSLTTSLLINYPAPLFLSLPIKLAVTGLEFNGEVVLAYEGASSPGRVHFCILDDLDPYGLATSVSSSVSRDGGAGTDPAAKPLPIGQRLLPSIFIESEIGQADKHMLKNVTRVERFIQDVIRKTVEDELVFPNFHTIVLGD